MTPKFSPEALVLRQFHPTIVHAIIHALLHYVMRPIRSRGNPLGILRAMNALNFYPFCAEYDESANVFQIYTPSPWDEMAYES